MSAADFRDPNTLLEPNVRAGIELVYASDPRLGATLDVPPPSIGPTQASAIVPVIQGTRNFAFRAARKAYRMLKRVKPLEPVLQRTRDRIRRRF